ncbi:ATP-grasp domain-containing protein [Vibrio sagamiensis]|uniref:ATP-grasp domain-containing protein n=1 Tax=Vibrio sagamiensis NBRC 104589 TaxID=1219064 RepID=A0A511QG07_9VIBR|nr:ATP-grasp domain-containing protein [Vibrio sagamiensis]PNQ55064.1 ATP-grasp domain-containing protein [Vibrio agarivorans]GEM76243.1 hypothetical protein VSA01S_23550 [Vibrio sagamiensis NBRC 104589]
MKTQAFILLIHQARSHVYANLIKGYLSKIDIKPIIITSMPLTQEHANKLAQVSEEIFIQDTDDLTQQGIDDFVSQIKQKYDVKGCLATYEGYRLLMAWINQICDVVDTKEDDIKRCFDKLQLRQILVENNLSSAEAHLVTEERLSELENQDGKFFIKPRRGIGSFSCFKYEKGMPYSQIERLQDDMKKDLRFKNIFCGTYDFICESYIEGDEYSFEVFVLDSNVYVVGTHAKFLETMFGTTLEVANSLPAAQLSDKLQKEGEDFVRACLSALQIEQGAYHIETRFDTHTAQWNIIEINPRMGGALINQSVGVFTEQYDFIHMWILSLIYSHGEKRAELKDVLSQLRESKRRADNKINSASVFISKYGEPGKTLAKLSVEQLRRTPNICEISATVGTKLPASNRGIFLLNALWKVEAKDLATELPFLNQVLEEDLIVEYE